MPTELADEVIDEAASVPASKPGASWMNAA